MHGFVDTRVGGGWRGEAKEREDEPGGGEGQRVTGHGASRTTSTSRG
jgi:hypothetical protein